MVVVDETLSQQQDFLKLNNLNEYMILHPTSPGVLGKACQLIQKTNEAKQYILISGIHQDMTAYTKVSRPQTCT